MSTMKQLFFDFLDLQKSNPWIAAFTVFCTQYVFLWARTKNVIATTQLQTVRALWTGFLINVSWLIAIAIGVDALWTGTWQPVVAHILGGLLGVYISLQREKKKRVSKTIVSNEEEWNSVTQLPEMRDAFDREYGRLVKGINKDSKLCSIICWNDKELWDRVCIENDICRWRYLSQE